MRRRTTAAAAIVVAALIMLGCSSTPTTNSPPPASTAASITIVSGDGQSAAPGSALPVKLSVAVKDASGQPVPGAAVHFTVDSGGGSTDVSTAATGSDGVAQGGDWTLGASTGTNVLSASVNAAILVRFHATASIAAARTLINAANVGTGGGTLIYTQAADPLNGLKLTVPAGAFRQATQWSITAAPASVTLPANAFLVGPAITVSNGQGYADSLMALRIPVHAGLDTALAAFFYDPGSGTFEVVPIVARDTSVIVIAVRHFSADQMLSPAATFPAALRKRTSSFQPAPAPAPSILLRAASAVLRTDAPPAFGSVTIVVVGLTFQQLDTDIKTSFTPGVDDWEFVNDGDDWLTASGICSGMTASALYYNYRYKAANGALFGRFDRLPGFDHDDIRGIRLASIVQSQFLSDPVAFDDFLDQTDKFALANGVSWDQVNYQSLVLAMYVTGRAQLLGLWGSIGAHTVIAYEAEAGQISVADPNYPGQPRGINHVSGRFSSYLASPYQGAAGGVFTSVALLGPTTVLKMNTIDALWQSLAAGTVGSSEFAGTSLEAWNSTTQTWDKVTSDTIHVASDTLMLRTNCSNCFFLRASSALPTRQATIVFDALGTRLTDDLPDAATGVAIPLLARTLVFGVQSDALSPNGQGPGVSFHLNDFRWLTVISTKISITPRNFTGPVDSTYRFTASNAGNLAAGSTFNWVVTGGGASTPYTIPNDSVLSVALNALGNWKIKVTLKDPGGVTLGADSTTVMITINPIRYRLSLGPSVSVAALADGTTRVWGLDNFGQLGDGDTVNKVSPVAGPAITGQVVGIAAGGLASAAVLNDGTVRTWGLNNFGTLGNGSYAQLPGGVDAQHAGPGAISPVGLSNVAQILTAGYHAMALKYDGTVWFWGDGEHGEVGNGGQGSPNVPTKIPNVSNVVAIASTANSAAALKADGTVWTWGGNQFGELGDNKADVLRTTPAQVMGLPRITRLMVGGGLGRATYLVVAADSSVWACGNNSFGQVGNGAVQTDQLVPIQVPGLSRVIDVGGGAYHSMALRADGTVWTWGDNTYGQLGDGTTNSRPTPAQVIGLAGIAGIAVGDVHSAAYSKDGTRVYLWGDNTNGAIGNGASGGNVTLPYLLFGVLLPATP